MQSTEQNSRPLTAEQKRERALQDVKLYMASDWELKEETPHYFLLRKHGDSAGKHLILFLFTCWTFGLANIIYYFLSRKEKKVFK